LLPLPEKLVTPAIMERVRAGFTGTALNAFLRAEKTDNLRCALSILWAGNSKSGGRRLLIRLKKQIRWATIAPLPLEDAKVVSIKPTI